MRQQGSLRQPVSQRATWATVLSVFSRIVGLTAVLATTVIQGGCGGGGGGPVVVRVRDTPITSVTVSHWMAVQAGGRTPRTQNQALRAQALDTLISTQWRIGEAREQDVSPSPQEIAQRVAEKERTTFPGGEHEQQEFLNATGETLSDLTLEADSELAAAAIQRRLTSHEPTITKTEVALFYTRHKQRFFIPEQRDLLTTNRKSAAEATAIKKAVASGKSFATMSTPQTVERLAETDPRERADTRIHAALQKAIYSAKPNTLTGPIRLRADYYLIEVKQITPARFEPLTQAAASIKKQLAEERRRRTISAFISAWRTKWTTRTNCRPGYIMQKCHEYKGPRPPEDPLSLN